MRALCVRKFGSGAAVNSPLPDQQAKQEPSMKCIISPYAAYRKGAL